MSARPSRPEVSIRASRLAILSVAALAAAAPGWLAAQDKGAEEIENQVWHIDGLYAGFCVRLLLEPAKLDLPMPSGVRPLRADAVKELDPALKSLVAGQPEFASWTPSSVCLYYMQSVDAGPVRVSERKPEKAPLLGVWALAAGDSSGQKDVVLRMFTNSGRLERAANINGLDLREIRSTVETITDDERPGSPPLGTRYRIRLGKAVLTWEGRKASDSTRADGPVAREWRAESRRHGSVTGRLLLKPEWSRPMIGWLQVEGKDDFASAIKASPIRFVGPAMFGGGGELAFSN